MFSRAHVGVLEQVAHTRDERGRHLRRLEGRERVGRVALAHPAGDELVDQRSVLEPRRRRGHARIRGQVGAAHRLTQAREHPVVGTGDRDPPPVASLVVVVGHRALRARTDPLAHPARAAEHGDRVVEHAQHRLVEPEIDDLALAVPLGVAQRHERADGAEHARQIVGHRGGAGRDRRAIGIAGQIREAADGGGDPPEARTLTVRAGLAERRDAHHDERRPDPRELVHPRFHRSSVPGRKFSVTTLAEATSRRINACPSGSLRLHVIDFLLRASTNHQYEPPADGVTGRPSRRRSLPTRGCSTLITSAPNSPRSVAQTGAAR